LDAFLPPNRDLEETIHVLKPYVTRPLTPYFNGGTNIILLIVIVSFFNDASSIGLEISAKITRAVA
jgi:hypothetical protein